MIVAHLNPLPWGEKDAKRQVRDTWKNHTLQLWGDDSREMPGQRLSVSIASSTFRHAVTDFGQRCIKSDCAGCADIGARLGSNTP